MKAEQSSLGAAYAVLKSAGRKALWERKQLCAAPPPGSGWERPELQTLYNVY